MHCLAFTLFPSTSSHVLALNFNIDLNYRYYHLEYALISDPQVLALNFNIDLNYRYFYLEYAFISDL